MQELPIILEGVRKTFAMQEHRIKLLETQIDHLASRIEVLESMLLV